MIDVSVLMAVYNSERFLRQSIDSVLGQTLRSIELICIDDGSTDSSPAILADYAARDKRVKIVTMEENMGPAKARNRGIPLCQGRTICMVDSDDFIASSALELAIQIYDSDMRIDTVLFRLYYFDQKTGVISNYEKNSTEYLWSGEEAFAFSLDWSLHGLYLSSADLFQRYQYDTTCRLYSDDNTTRIHYLRSRKVAQSEGKYFYRQHSQESTKRTLIRRFDLLEANESMARQISRFKVSPALVAKFEAERWINLVGIITLFFDRKRELTISQRMEIRKRVRHIYSTINRAILPRTLTRKVGYMPLWDYSVFRIEVRLYHFLRRLFAKKR